jgi:hypothetical protein
MGSYWLTRIGLKPWRKKIDAILRLNVPHDVKEVCAFVGGYYLFPRHVAALI